MKQCGIYGIFNTTDRKVLVGSTSNMYHRWWVHRNDANNGKHKNPHFQSAWNKHNESSFEFRVIEECDVNSLIPREDYWMAFYKSLDKNFGYNMQNATHSFRSEETRKILSIKNKGRKAWNKDIPMREESKELLRIAKTGTHLSAKNKKMLSERWKGEGNPNYGKHYSAEERLKFGNEMRGKHHTAETIEKMQIAHTGERNHFYGKKHSDETKAKCSLGRKGKPISEEHKQAIRDFWKHRRELKSAQSPTLQPAVNQ